MGRDYFASPAVVVQVRACAALWGLACAVLLLGGVVLAYWSLLGRPGGKAAVPVLLVWGLWTALGWQLWRAWLQQPFGLLRWEGVAGRGGQHWLWQDLATVDEGLPLLLGRPLVLLDAGAQLWLLFRPLGQKRYFFCVQQRHNPQHWAAVRRAVYSPA